MTRGNQIEDDSYASTELLCFDGLKGDSSLLHQDAGTSTMYVCTKNRGRWGAGTVLYSTSKWSPRDYVVRLILSHASHSMIFNHTLSSPNFHVHGLTGPSISPPGRVTFIRATLHVSDKFLQSLNVPADFRYSVIQQIRNIIRLSILQIDEHISSNQRL